MLLKWPKKGEKGFMEITSMSSISYQPVRGAESLNTTKQLFDKLGNALESGNLTDAQDAMTELQKYAPPKAGNDNNPMKAKMEELSQSLESGDLAAAQKAYAEVKSAMAQRSPSGGGQPGGPGGPGGPPPDGASQSSGAGNSSSSSKTYDKKDLNKDGTVTAVEELLYGIEHPDNTTSASSAADNSNSQGLLDVTA
jgi:hypothetical protein